MRIIFSSIIPLLVLICMPSSAQNRVDSLKDVLSHTSTKTERLKILLQICSSRGSIHEDSLLKYGNETKTLALQLGRQDKAIEAELAISKSLNRKNLRDSALSIVTKNISWLNRYHTDSNLLIRYMLLKTFIYIRDNKHKEALANALETNHLAEAYGDKLMMLQCLSQTGLVHMEVGQDAEAIRWFRLAYDLPGISRSTPGFQIVYSNLSSCYNNIGKYDSAFYFAKLARYYAEINSDYVTIANILNIEADIYLNTKQPALAEKNLLQVVEVRKKTGDMSYMVADMGQLATFYAKIGKTKEAIATANEAITIAYKNNIFSKLSYLYTCLADSYKAAGDYKEYSKVLEKKMAITDSMFQKNSADAIASLQARFELQKMETALVQQKLDLQKQDFRFYGLLAVLLMVLFIGYFIFRDYRRRQKISMERVLFEEKRMAEKAVASAEEQERKRIAADLHDNLGAYAASMASNLNYINISNSDSYTLNALNEVRNNSGAIISQLNDTIWALKKEALSMTAISDRIKNFVTRIQKSYPDILIEVEEHIATDHQLPSSQAFHLYMIIQEAINNALKHSKADSILVNISANSSWVVSITDNGTGLSEYPPGKGGNGVTNMISRSREAGWRIEWQPFAPSGTRVLISTTN